MFIIHPCIRSWGLNSLFFYDIFSNNDRFVVELCLTFIYFISPNRRIRVWLENILASHPNISFHVFSKCDDIFCVLTRIRILFFWSSVRTSFFSYDDRLVVEFCLTFIWFVLSNSWIRVWLKLILSSHINAFDITSKRCQMLIISSWISSSVYFAWAWSIPQYSFFLFVW